MHNAHCPAESGSEPVGRHDEQALATLLTALAAENYRFITVTPATHARINRRPGNHQARDLAGIFGWSRPFERTCLAPSLFDSLRHAELVYQDGALWRSRVRVSHCGDSLFVHTAYPTDHADSVFLGPDTYRYVRALRDYLDRAPSAFRRAVDIGCGAGPGAVLLARSDPAAIVFAVDINHAALAMTRANALHAGAMNVTTQYSNLLQDLEGDFDLIVANPPYVVDPARRTYRDGGGALGLGLSEAIARTAMQRLAPGGTMLLYTGAPVVAGVDVFRRAILPVLRETGFSVHYEEVDPDVFGEELECTAYQQVDRIAAVVLTARRPL